MLTALRHGIEKRIIDNGQINLITTNQSQASLSINQSRYLSLNIIIKENEKNVKVSFILKKPDGTIYDQYYKKYTNINLSIIISTLIDLIPAWALNTMINNGENETSINEENIQFQYPMDYYELLGILNSQETNNIQDAIIKLEELDITDEAKWIDLMMAEAYTKGFMNNKSERFLNAAENILMQNQFLESEAYIMRSFRRVHKGDIQRVRFFFPGKGARFQAD